MSFTWGLALARLMEDKKGFLRALESVQFRLARVNNRLRAIFFITAANLISSPHDKIKPAKNTDATVINRSIFQFSHRSSMLRKGSHYLKSNLTLYIYDADGEEY